jgi:hypothetical protein
MWTNKLVRAVPNSEPENTENLRKTYSQVVSNNISEAKHTMRIENMLTQKIKICVPIKLRAVQKLLRIANGQFSMLH